MTVYRIRVEGRETRQLTPDSAGEERGLGFRDSEFAWMKIRLQPRYASPESRDASPVSGSAFKQNVKMKTRRPPGRMGQMGRMVE